MDKMLFYAMRGDKACFLHALLNAQDLAGQGWDVKIVLEGQAVTLPRVLEEEKNPLYLKAKQRDWFAGICLACSRQLGVYEYNQALDVPLLSDMGGHAGMLPFLREGFAVVVM